MTRWSRGFETLRALLDPRAEIPFDVHPLDRSMAMDGAPARFRREPPPAEKHKAKPRHSPQLCRPRPDKERKRSEAALNALEKQVDEARHALSEKRAARAARQRKQSKQSPSKENRT
jgi:hypothetical protein